MLKVKIMATRHYEGVVGICVSQTSLVQGNVTAEFYQKLLAATVFSSLKNLLPIM